MSDSEQLCHSIETNPVFITSHTLKNNKFLKTSISPILSSFASRKSFSNESIEFDKKNCNNEIVVADKQLNTSDNLLTTELDFKERLRKVASIWFLCEVGRSEVVDLLKDKDSGFFIVRQSSKPNALALSLRLPFGKGPYIEHYLIEDAGQSKIHLEGSENYFSCVLDLIVHYCQCCDELPVQLLLPPILMKANLLKLTCYSYLGKNFWQYLKEYQTYSCNDLNEQLSDSSSNKCEIVNTKSPRTSFCSSILSFVSSSQAVNDLASFNEQKTLNFINSVKLANNAIKNNKSLTPPKPLPRTSILNKNGCLPPPVPSRTCKPHIKINENNFNFFNSLSISTPSLHLIGDLRLPIKSEEKNNKFTSIDEYKQSILKSQENLKLVKNSQEKTSHQSSYQQNFSNIDHLMNNKNESLICHYNNEAKGKFSDYEDIWNSNFNQTSCKEFNKLKTLNKPQQILTSQSTQTCKNITKPNHFSFLFYNQPFDSIKFKKIFNFRSDSNLMLSFFKSNFTQNKSHSFENLLYDKNKLLNEKSLIEKKVCRNILNYYHDDNHIHLYNQSHDQTLLNQVFSKNDNIEQAVSKSNESETSIFIDNAQFFNKTEKNSSSLSDSFSKCQHPNKKLCKATDIKTFDEENDGFLAIPCPTIRTRKFNSLSVSKSDGTLNQDQNLDNTYKNMLYFNKLIVNNTPELKSSKLELNLDQEKTDHNFVTLRNKESYLDKVNTMKLNKISNCTLTDTETIFSEPWDSEYWENLINDSINQNNFSSFFYPHHKNSFWVTNKNLNQPECVIKQRNLKEKISSVNSDSTEKQSILSQDENCFLNNTKFSTFNLTEILSLKSDYTSDTTLPSVCFHKKNELDMRFELLNNFDFNNVHSKSKSLSKVAKNVRNYIYKLAKENDNTFAKLVSHFIECTKACQESNPQIVIGNIRQFMNGMKNYMVKHGEKNFLEMIKKERNKLKKNEFLNIDSIIENTLHKLIIKPLKDHLKHLFVEEYTKNKNLQVLSYSIKTAQTMQNYEFGLKPNLNLPNQRSMNAIKNHFDELQRVYSPFKKLEHLLAVISILYDNVNCKQSTNSNKSSHFSFGVDDFLPLFIYVIVKCNFISVEIEAEYIRGLLHPSLLSGEADYYLTTLSSCIQVLKNLNQITIKKNCRQELNATKSSSSINSMPSLPSLNVSTTINDSKCSSFVNSRINSLTDCKGFIKIMIPNELSCSITTKTLPVRPDMTSKEFCKMIAHKFNVTNSEEYGLFQLTDDSNEIQIDPEGFPHFINLEQIAAGKKINFVYKRVGAKFLWPKISDHYHT